MNKRTLKFTIGVVATFILLNVTFLFLPLIIGIGGTQSDLVTDAQRIYTVAPETSNCTNERTKINNDVLTDDSSAIAPATEIKTEDAVPSDFTKRLTCKIYNDIETEDFKIYDDQGIVRVEVKGDYADSAVDYLRGQGCAPLASGNIVYIINGREIRL